jgi:hypothetical protein
LPIVQSGATKKVSVDNLTAGRAVSAASVTASTGDIVLSIGNLIISTSGRGIDFSATPNTGTSEVLADYEEGTWTPTQGSGLTVVGTFSSAGTYTKVGRVVNFSGTLTGSTSIAVAAGGLMTSGLPYATPNAFYGIGGATNAIATSGSLFATSIVTLYAVSAITATTTIYFSGAFET